MTTTAITCLVSRFDSVPLAGWPTRERADRGAVGTNIHEKFWTSPAPGRRGLFLTHRQPFAARPNGHTIMAGTKRGFVVQHITTGR